MIKAIIFDFAGVVATDGYWVWLEENVQDIQAKRPFFLKLSERVDKGEISKEKFEQTIAKYTGFTEDKIWPGVREKIVINDDIVKLIKGLRKKYKVALLSNFVYEWLDEILTTNSLYEIFNATVISSQHGMIKPEKEIFQKMLNLLKLDKNEVIFIDDRQMQVNGANEFGIKALLYTTTDTLKQELIKNGVKIDGY